MSSLMIYNQYHANLKYEIWKCTLKQNKPPLAMIIKIKTLKLKANKTNPKRQKSQNFKP